MQRSDIFPTLIAFLILGGGLYLSTFPTVIIHWIGLAIMALAFIGMALWLDLRPPEKIGRIITGIPIAISRIQLHAILNYAGFPVDRRECDAQLISFGVVTMTNISATENVALNFVLRVTGPGGVNINANADLIGPFGMILGKDDNAAKQFANRSFGKTPKYFRNPVELGPQKIERKRLAFLFDFGPELRDKVSMILIRHLDYKFDLEIKDLMSDRHIVISVPGEYRGDQ